MKTPQEWMRWIEQETVDPMQKGVTHEVLLTEEAISAIQKDAFDAGRVDAVDGAIYALEQHGFDLAHQFLKLRRDQLTQPKDTPCSKNTPLK